MSVKTILFVEDDPLSMAVYLDPLERAGFRLECAQDGLAAFKILANMVPDLVLLDLNLPKFDGVQVLRYLQADPRLTDVPVIILSNAAMGDIVPADSPLKAKVQSTRRLLKTKCTFTTLLGTIRESLAASPRSAESHARDRKTVDVAMDAAFDGFVWMEPTPRAAKTGDLSHSVPSAETEPRYKQLEDELVAMRKLRDELQGKSTEAQQAVTKAQEENKELQHRLRDGSAELEKIKNSLKRQAVDWARLESELRGQLTTATAMAAQIESALEEKDTQCSRMEKELAQLQQESRNRSDAEAKAKAELDQHSSDRSRLEKEISALKEKEARVHHLEKELAEVKRTESALAEKASQCARLEIELAQLQLERRVRADAEARARADLEKHSSDRARLEKEIGALREKEMRCQLLEKEVAELKNIESALKEKSSQCGRMEKELSQLQRERKDQSGAEARARAELEQHSTDRTRLEQEIAGLREKDARCQQLEKELAELQKSRDDLQNRLAAEQQAVEKSQHGMKELRKRLEQAKSDLARLDLENQDLAETRKTLSQGLRRMQEAQATREVEMLERQKKLVEALRQGAQFFQTRLAESDPRKAAPGSPAPGNPGTGKPSGPSNEAAAPHTMKVRPNIKK